MQPSINAAYRAKAEEIGVTVKAVYDKLKGIEPGVCRELIRETADHLASIIENMGGKGRELLPGYRVKIVDGNHLRRTDRRIAETCKAKSTPWDTRKRPCSAFAWPWRRTTFGAS